MTMSDRHRTAGEIVLSSALAMVTGGRLTRASDAAIRVIETAYAPIGDEGEWLGELLRGLDDLELGDSFAYTIAEGRTRTIVRASSDDENHIRAVTERTSRAVVDAAHAPSPRVDHSIRRVARVAEALGTTVATLEAQQGFPVRSTTGVLGTNADASGAMFILHGHATIAPRTKRVLTEVAAHIAAAFRLRMRIAEDRIEGADAIYEPSGKLVDANPAGVAGREPLALAVKSVERARGKLRSLDPGEAVTSWKALVDGRWTLVDHVERDGKRFVLAHKNEAPSTVASLREREAQVATLAALGHSDKHIAYELGLQSSTVATHLRRALVKLRLPDRRALVLTFGPLVRVRALTST